MNNNYVCYHLHSDYSNGVTNVDSVTKFNKYVDKAKSLGMKAMAFSEHGSVFNWLEKKEAIEKASMKYIHAEEFYVCNNFERFDEDGKRIRENFHTVLIAKNFDGVKELNRLSSASFNRQDGHYYFLPRITIDELCNTSDNIIVTSACLASPLSKGYPEIKEKYLQFFINHKDRCYLEIQHHNVKDQIEYNKCLYEFHKTFGIPLIAGTDTHALDRADAEARKVLQKAKDVFFEGEDGWDLTFKSYNELLDAYRIQNALPMDVVLEAIDNTNKMADEIEEFSVDKSHKYPHLWDNPEQTLKDDIEAGVERRNIKTYQNYDEYKKRIDYEFSVYKHNKAIDFILLMVDVADYCRNHGIQLGYGRGSVTGSLVCWLLGITEMDSIKFNLNFERFMNTERVSLADIDSDIPPNRRDEVINYLFNHKGLYCSDIITFNTIALKGAIRDVCRALYQDPEKDKKASKPRYLEITDYLSKGVDTNEDKMRKEYPEVFKYVDRVNGVIVSIGTHPCGRLTYDHPLDDVVGLCSTSTDEHMVSQLYMHSLDECNYVKLDCLALDTIELIHDTCQAANIPMLLPDNMDVHDDKVWNDIRDNTVAVFQWESDTAQDYIKKLLSDETIKKFQKVQKNVNKMELLTIGNSAIRPAGASYRDDLANGVVRTTGSKAIDEFLEPTFGYLCIEENEFVSTDMGIKKIKDIKVGDVVYNKDGCHKVQKVFDNGHKKVFDYITKFGKIKCTPEHNIYTLNGWKKAGDITEQDSIGFKVGTNSKKEIDKNILRILGWLIGDGTLTKKNNVGLINRDKDVIDEFGKCVQNIWKGEIETETVVRGSRVNNIPLYFTNVRWHKRKYGVEKPIITMLKEFDLHGKTACDKCIPKEIFSLSKKSLLHFLGAYTDTDSCIKNKGKVTLMYKTASKQLAIGLKEVIRLLGYNCSVQNYNNAYNLCIRGASELLNELYDYSIKVRKAYPNGIKIERYNKNGDIAVDYLIKLLNDNNITNRKAVYRKTGINLYTHNKSIRVEYARKILDAYGLKEKYQDIFDDTIHWFMLEKVVPYGEKHVYDLQIEDEHNFLVDGIITHNCYQEQIIFFLHLYCGFTMGQADVVRRGFAKKTGTEQYIPIIKNGGYMPNDEKHEHHIDGFIKTMHDKYGTDSAKAEHDIVAFLQVIEDASSYLFSQNHSTPYSYEGYASGWLRYYYPLEFLSTALNINSKSGDAKKKDVKEKKLIAYANSRGIKIISPKFRYAKSGYSFNKEENIISKGVGSIKNIGEDTGDKLATLNDFHGGFVDLLYKIFDKPALAKKNEIEILIKIGYFSEYGSCKKLLYVYSVFQQLFNKKNIKKEKAEALHLTDDMVSRFAEKTTDTQYTKVDVQGLLNCVFDNTEDFGQDIYEQAAYESQLLGYVSVTDDKLDWRDCVVVSVDDKYSPKVGLYCLNNSKITIFKFHKKADHRYDYDGWNEKKLSIGDSIHIDICKQRPKSVKDENGEWQKDYSVMEWWIDNYSIIYQPITK